STCSRRRRQMGTTALRHASRVSRAPVHLHCTCSLPQVRPPRRSSRPCPRTPLLADARFGRPGLLMPPPSDRQEKGAHILTATYLTALLTPSAYHASLGSGTCTLLASRSVAGSPPTE